MATIRDIPGTTKALVSWYDASHERQRFALPKKKAQELYDQVCAQKIFEKSGLSPMLGQKSKHIMEMTFRDLATTEIDGKMSFEDYLKGTRAKSNISYINRLLAKWGDWRLNQITSVQVRSWVMGILRQPKGTRDAISTIKKLVAYMKRVFNYACEMEILNENPIRNLENEHIKTELRRVNKRTIVISTEQFWKLIEKFPQWMKGLCICAWCTGMRLGEIISLKWGEVNLVDRIIELQADLTKEADNKTIGIEQDLFDVLIDLQTRHGKCGKKDFVFLSLTGLQIGRNFFSSQFRKYADEAGFDGLVFHDFRHCYTVRKRKEGFDKSVIKAQTGHHTDHMFNWYNKVDRAEIQEMAGFTNADCGFLMEDLIRLTERAKEKGISLGVVQSLLTKTWKVAVQKMPKM